MERMIDIISRIDTQNDVEIEFVDTGVEYETLHEEVCK